MSLAFEITKISADVYAMIAEVAECLQGSSKKSGPTGRNQRQRQLTVVQKIVETFETTRIRLWLLDSRTTTERPEMLKRYLEDCWTALVKFRGVCVRLAGIIRSDGWGKPSAAASESLAQMMEQLGTCSEKVSAIPASGVAVSSHYLAEIASKLRGRATKLVKQPTGHS